MKLSDKTYNIMKWLAVYLIPALGTLYFAIASIWGLPYSGQVVGSLTALDTFLGVILGISTSAYNKSDKDGTLRIDTGDSAKDIYRLTINGNLTDVSAKKTITLTVDPKADLSQK